jgi:putative ABC transport system permease protein
MPILTGCALFVGLLSGSYPAFYLTAFNPVAVIKRNLSRGKKSGGVRSGLVIFQFTCSIVLLLSTSVVYRQLYFMQNKDLGFNKENVVIIHNLRQMEKSKQEPLKVELKRLSPVLNAGYGWMVPSSGADFEGGYYRSASDARDWKNALLTSDNYIDYDYLSTLGLQLVAGRNFSPEHGTDDTAVMVNETAARELGLKEPVGKKLYTWNSRKTDRVDEQGESIWEEYVTEIEVVGVIRDYHHHSLHQKIKPLFYVLCYGEFSEWDLSLPNLVVRIDGSDLRGTLKQIENVWNKLMPDTSFHYFFLDENIEVKYRDDLRFGQMVGISALLAIIIACLGIFGLIAFTAERRTKEIGIRKTLGASISNIVVMLSKETTKWVLIACTIAVPIGYWVVNRWLENFAYRTDLSATVFVLACLVAFLIALLTVGSQAFRAARANPVDSLRYE